MEYNYRGRTMNNHMIDMIIHDHVAITSHVIIDYETKTAVGT